mgnify:CR=1 FL=1|jgi:hypothetical protein
MQIHPTNYGLPATTKLQEIGYNHLAIVRVIKSRIIQKDALKIVETAQQITGVNPRLKVSLMCTPNICSKSKALLQKEGIELIYVQ